MSPIQSSADGASASMRSAGPRAELLHVLTLPDLELPERVGEFWGYPRAGLAVPSSNA